MAKAPKIRQKLIDNFAILINQYGYNGSPMASLAELSQLKKASLYHHFKSKEALLLALIQQAHHELTQYIEHPRWSKIEVEQKFEWLNRFMNEPPIGNAVLFAALEACGNISAVSSAISQFISILHDALANTAARIGLPNDKLIVYFFLGACVMGRIKRDPAHVKNYAEFLWRS